MGGFVPHLFEWFAGAAQTPKIVDSRPAQQSCIKNPSVISLALGSAAGGGSRGYPPVPFTNGRALNGGLAIPEDLRFRGPVEAKSVVRGLEIDPAGAREGSSILNVPYLLHPGWHS